MTAVTPGVKDAEGCRIARLNEASRAVAARPLIEQGMKSRSGKRLEKMLGAVVARAKAIRPDTAELKLQPLAWIDAVCGRADDPILDVNRWALDHGVIMSGPPEAIRQEVREIIQQTPAQFMLGADCTVPSDTPWNNLTTAIQTAHTSGEPTGSGT
jgi:hypothetical protein